MQADGGFQEGGEVRDVVGPEDGFDFSEFIFRQISRAQLAAGFSVHAVDIIQQAGGFGFHDDVGAVGFQFLVHLVPDIQHDVEHAGGQGSPQGDGEGDQQHFSFLAEKCAADHAK